MEESIKSIIEKLLESNRGELDLDNHDYFLFFQDGFFTISIDDNTKELKLKVQLTAKGQTKVFHTNDSIRNYIGG